MAYDERLDRCDGIATGYPQRVAARLMLDRRLAKPITIDADQTAIDALGYTASKPDLIKRFLDLPGIGADEIRQAADQPSFFVGVLDFLLANENELVAFSRATGARLEAVRIARDKLDLGSGMGR